MTPAAVDWHALAPYAVLTGAVVLATLLPPASGTDAASTRRAAPGLIALAGLTAAAALFVSLLASGGDRRLFEGRFTVDRAAAAAGLVVVLCAYALVVALLRGWAGGLLDPRRGVGIVAAALGLAGLAAARDAGLCVVALELAAVAAAVACSEGGDADPEPVERARLAGVVALALEAYAVGVTAVVAGTTRLAALGERLGGPRRVPAGIAVVVLGAALAARAASTGWAIVAARGRPRGARNPGDDRPVG